MTVDDLHKRLDALSERITDMEARLKERSSWHDGHRLTSGELDARYRYLKSKLDGEVKAIEAHGHHVSDLEVSVRKWIDVLDMNTE